MKKPIGKKRNVHEKEIPTAKLLSIKRGLKDIEEGKVYLHSEIRKIYEKRLLRSLQ
jgi:predicted transcriptional regulator